MSQADWPRFMLRLPPDLKGWVDVEAERNGASINSEIIRSVRERMERTERSVKSPEISGEKPAPAGEISANGG
ncbi:Arc family DNA-binding protein [Xanthobacter autotrophicus]|uniref:Arc family DNA-binding protein n=1 Tax=Xanthobacter autotrophicus TaxID=280 RepID=UPI003726459C